MLAGERRHRSRNRAIRGLRGLRRSLRWSLGSLGWTESPAASSGADGGRRAEWALVSGGSRSKLIMEVDSRDEERASGEESGEGKALVAPK